MLVLAYHSIRAERDDPLAVAPTNFLAQIRWLRRSYTVVRLTELVAAFRGGSIEKNIAAITFDDGLCDNYEILFPIVRSLGIPITIFLPIDYIGSSRLFEGEHLAGDSKVEARFRSCMTWEQVHEMAEGGVEFGSHSFSHRRLSKLTHTELEHEIAGSRSWLQEKLQQPVDFFCYPFGDFDERCINLVKAAGYSGAVVTPSRDIPSTVFTLHRVGVYRHNSLPVLRLKASALGQRLRGMSLIRAGLGGRLG